MLLTVMTLNQPIIERVSLAGPVAFSLTPQSSVSTRICLFVTGFLHMAWCRRSVSHALVDLGVVGGWGLPSSWLAQRG